MTRFHRLTVVAIAAAAIAPAAHAAPGPPSVAKQKSFWGMTATPKRGVQLISDNSPSQNRITLRNLRIASSH